MPILSQRTAGHVFGGAAEAGQGKGRIYRSNAGLVKSRTPLVARIPYLESHRSLVIGSHHMTGDY
ncbi:hypothetical protein COMA2_10448 [Candidatus Nitrospira nitrificans]|uniref:Uncharacterized protein n=1 Tax=Candidatus Nitrospira nitrificans TaxID=1742973 RepID=A0A0S4L335_9BACT|nr:hypothetical protein COMA2_10448 [Candidatus Nitrospira nitrificans]